MLKLTGEGSDCPPLMAEIRPLGGPLARRGALEYAESGRDAAFLPFLLGSKTLALARASSEASRNILAAMAPYGHTIAGVPS